MKQKQSTQQSRAIAWRFLVAAAMLAALHTASAASLTWNTGGPTDTWSLTTGNANWLPSNEWTDGNAAVFDNATGETITISGTVSPTSVTVGANNGSWSFTGSGAIGGSSTLTKSGTGTLTILTANTYSGNTTISAGVVNIQNNTALGNTTGTVSVSTNAQLQLQGGITVTGKTLSINSTTGGSLLNVSGNNEWAGTINAPAGGSGSSIVVTAGALTLSGSLVIGGGGSSFAITNNSNMAISGIISGAGGFSIAGGGTTTISGANTFGDATHGMTINSGSATVQVTDSTTYAAGNQTITNNGLGSSSNIFTFGANTGSSILQLRANGQNDATAQTLTYGNNVSITGASGVNGTINVDRQGGTGTNKTLALGNVTTGANGGTLHVTGANGYSLSVGAVTITGASKTAAFDPTTANLTIASVSNTGSGTDVLKLDGTSTGNAVTGVISDGSALTSLTKSNTSTWVLQGANTYTGATSITGGALNIQNNSALGTGAGTSTSGVAVSSGAALQLQGNISTTTAVGLTLNGAGVTASPNGALENVSGNNTYSGLITLGAASTIGSDAGTLNLTNTGTITGATRALTLTGSGNGSLASIIGTTTGTLTKNGTGTWTLSGNSTYTGTTSINAGTLLINGNNSAATGAVTVSANATLGGTGTIGGATTAQSNSFLAPGTDGTAGNLTLASTLDISGLDGGTAGNLKFDLGSVGGSDKITLSSGVLTIGTGTLNFDDFSFTSLSGFGAGTYTLFDTTQTITGTLGANLTGTINGLSATLSFANASQDIILTVVPEPSTYAMVAGGFAMLIGLQGWRRRRL